MNPVRFNDKLIEVEAQLIREHCDPNLPDTWTTAPLFGYESIYDREKQLLKNAPKETMFKVPFSVFRMAVVCRDKERGVYKADYVIDARDPDSPSVIVLIKELFDAQTCSFAEDNLWRRVMPLAFYIHDFRWNDRDYSDGSTEGTVLYNSAFRYGGHWVRMQENMSLRDIEIIREMEKSYANAALDSLAAFALDSMCPTAHVAMVKPDTPNRSVEWTRQRTHYTLIYHGHPASRLKPQNGSVPTVRANPDEELTRMAHARRAHFKTLQHPRYRYKRGQRIFVRAAWVGPKEWRDDGSKQIYKILEPVAEEKAA
jgi:hypothetical protein